VNSSFPEGRAVDRSSPAITGEVPELENQPTSQSGRAVDRLRSSRGVVLERPNGSASPERRSTKTSRGRDHDTDTAQRTLAATSADIIDSHVTIAAENSLRSAEPSRTSGNRVRLGWIVRLR